MQLASVVMLCMLALFSYSIHVYQTNNKALHQLQLEIAAADNLMLTLRRNEKDFLSRIDVKYLDQFIETANTLQDSVQRIERLIKQNDLDTKFAAEAVDDNIMLYVDIFIRMSTLHFIINGERQTETGLIDELKDDWFDITDATMGSGDTKLESLLVNIQENTYYFFRTFERSHLWALHVSLDLLIKHAEDNHQESLTTLHNYKNRFKELEQAYEQFGYDYNSGLFKELRIAIHHVESNLSQVYSDARHEIADELYTIQIQSQGVLLAMGVTLAIVLLFVTNSISKLERRIRESSEQAKTSNIAKSAFLANMSHEIRTPLNGIIGMSEILSETRLTPTQEEYLDTVETSSHTLLMLINDILDLSKIESGHLSVTAHTSDAREVIYDSAAMVMAKIVEKSLQLNIDISPEVPARVLLDEHRLRQILMNLMSNAVKFTDKGSISLKLSTSKSAETNHLLLHFAISDSGIGIAKDKQEKIFAPFTQEDDSITRQFGGTGLGLNISYQLVELMGGNLEINSTKGVGSTFFFTLDVDTNLPQPQLPQAITKKKIAIISSELFVVNCLKTELGVYNFASISSSNNIEQTQDSDIILYHHQASNLVMSHISDLSLKHPNTPIIVVHDILLPSFDYNDKIDGLVKFPLLGSRLIKVIQNSYENFQHRQSLSTIDSTPLAPEETQTNTGNDQDNSRNTTDNFRNKKDHKVDETTSLPVLIVEDNLVNQKVATLFLKKGGFSFEIANNGLEALNMIKDGNTYQVVLMDCMMPVMDGFTATTEIRQFEQENNLAPMPIIALTASVLDQDVQKCSDVGMDGYLCKPLKKDKLYEMIEQHVAH